MEHLLFYSGARLRGFEVQGGIDNGTPFNL